MCVTFPKELPKAQGLGQERAESTSSEYAGGHPGLFHAQVNLSTSRDRAVLQQEQAATTPRLKRYAAVLALLCRVLVPFLFGRCNQLRVHFNRHITEVCASSSFSMVTPTSFPLK